MVCSGSCVANVVDGKEKDPKRARMKGAREAG